MPFYGVEFTDKGEIRHRTIDEADYGPDFEMFANVIVDFKLRPVIVGESPVLDVDATKMRSIFRKELKN